MTEQAPAATSAEDAAARRASEQARLRKERREARIKAGGTSRLNKITGVAGSVPKETAASPNASSSSAPAATSAPTADSKPSASEKTSPDPPEGDIAQHVFPARPSDSQLRHMMLNFDTPPSSRTPPPSFPGAAGFDVSGTPQMPPGMENDPIAQILRQMMTAAGPGGHPPGAGGGDMPGGGGADNPFAAFSSLLNPQAGGGSGGRTTPQKPLHIWRILHTLSTLTLILYFALTTHYKGTLSQREVQAASSSFQPGGPEPPNPSFGHAEHFFFFSFATLESCLLTSRFLVEKFSPGSRMDARSGILWTIAGVVPRPFSTWLETGLRYKSIFDTLLTDLLLVIFVLGVTAWVRS